ncbi:putative uncharacterized protein [Firmicutes bacterium CAG:882]|nr:putative uncharacterized protein [Firmicutes bacterium CAG:882]
MHLYLKAVGLGSINTRREYDKLIRQSIKESIEKSTVMYSDIPYLPGDKVFPAQIKHYFNKVCGISLNGFYDPKRKSFKLDYVFPFLDGSVESYESEVSIGRKTEREAFNALCDEPGRGIALIFHLSNPIDYLMSKPIMADFNDKTVRIAAMANEGTVLLPVNKSEHQIDKCRAATAARNNLINLAKKGDTAAIDNLTIEDLDTYTDIYKRMHNEDVFTIVDSSFMPSGFECDSYSVVGNIVESRMLSNNYTGEDVYVMTLECNDIVFDMCINARDLIGEPAEGRRFKGRIWLQGQVEF